MVDSQPLSTTPYFRSSLASSPHIKRIILRRIGGEKIFIQVDASTSVMTIHEEAQRQIGIPIAEQILTVTYDDVQLVSEARLACCPVKDESTIYVSRRISSESAPRIEAIINYIREVTPADDMCMFPMVYFFNIRVKFIMFLDSISLEDVQLAKRQLDEFIKFSGVSAFAEMHYSLSLGCIEWLLRKILCVYRDDSLRENCIVILRSLTTSLRDNALQDSMYIDSLIVLHRVMGKDYRTSRRLRALMLLDLSKYVIARTRSLMNILTESIASPSSPSCVEIYIENFLNDFGSWLKCLKEEPGIKIPISFPLDEKVSCSLLLFGEECELLRIVYNHLLMKIGKCLQKLEEQLLATQDNEDEDVVSKAGRSHYLTILMELHRSSKILLGAEQKFWEVMKCNKRALCALIDEHVESTDAIYHWLLLHRNKLGFVVRRQLALLLFSEPDNVDEKGLVIDRSVLFDESFVYVLFSEADSIKAGVYIKFRNEDASGPGVLREWFCLVCQDLFSQQTALFLSCPKDRRRFYPNPASTAIFRYQKYFQFCGRMIALALLHRVQVGILFDHSFFLQLSGRSVALENIRHADPEFYHSCKEILKMEASLLDSDTLGLTFSTEVEELGSRSVLELCSGGENIQVNSENKEEYIDLLIHHHFVRSTANQVANFAQGFSDILLHSHSTNEDFFGNLKLNDLDRMLGGSKCAMSVKHWKAHTDYNGYTETDPQILWFWKIVKKMSPEQKSVLLYYWTSVKYLPYDGFSGLDERLRIFKASDSLDCLPTSHTCFYQLCFPPYPTMKIMEDRLRVITQKDFCSTFGLP